MRDHGETPSTTIEFEAADGMALVGDLAVTDDPVAAAIVCHPHPQFGGDRFNQVVEAVFTALPAAGVAALRFDFRAEFDEGRGERLDALAALDALARRVPDVPLVATGYSFGALIALALNDDRTRSVVAIAPPLAVGAPIAAPTTPTLVLTPAHDQFSPPDASEPVIATWREARSIDVVHESVEMADHLLGGQTRQVATRTAEWIGETVSG